MPGAESLGSYGTVDATLTSLHIPVLLTEVLHWVREDDLVVVDMTVGRAGHASNILQVAPRATLYGFDRDADAISYSQRKLDQDAPGRSRLYRTDFAQAVGILKDNGVKGMDFCLFDTGVSSPQFDDGERGFSYRVDAPLDMRMDRSQQLTARDVVNTYSAEELERILREYSGEKYAKSIARSIVRQRERKPLETTYDLVDAVRDGLPARVLRKQGHPAKQTFMAIRMEVNSEREELNSAVRSALDFLNPGGRLCVITFNSDDDALVKHIFQEYSPREEGSRYLPPVPTRRSEYNILTRKPETPKSEELDMNPRSQSAKMRVIERRQSSD